MFNDLGAAATAAALYTNVLTRMAANAINSECGPVTGSDYVVTDANASYEVVVFKSQSGGVYAIPIVANQNDQIAGTPAGAGWVTFDYRGTQTGFLDNTGAAVVVAPPPPPPPRVVDAAQTTTQVTQFHANEMGGYHADTVRNLQGNDRAKGKIRAKGAVTVPYATTDSGWVNLTQEASSRNNVRIDLESYHQRPDQQWPWQRIKLQEAGGQIGGWLLWCGDDPDEQTITYSAAALADSFDLLVGSQRYILVYPSADGPTAFP